MKKAEEKIISPIPAIMSSELASADSDVDIQGLKARKKLKCTLMVWTLKLSAGSNVNDWNQAARPA